MNARKLPLAVALLSLFSVNAIADESAVGRVEVEVAVQNVIESISVIDLGTKTAADLTSGAISGSSDLKIYTTAAETPAGGLSVTAEYNKFDEKPYLSIEAAGEEPSTPLFYAATITACNSATELALTGETPSVNLTDNVLSSDCASPGGAAGTLKITLEQYDDSTRPPIVGGNYDTELTLTVGPAA